MRVLVVVPTYNEAENIERILRRVREVLPEAGMLVVDDGSPDGTADLVEGAAPGLGDVHVLRRQQKSGLGSAYRAGFAWGLDRGYDACVEMDADFSHDPAALPALLAPLDAGAEVAIGSRRVPGGSIPDWSWLRRLISWAGNVYATVLLGLGVRDSTAGFRAYAASVLRRLDLDAVRAEGYGFQIEMTFRAKQAGAAITEVPIRFVDRVAGESKMSSAIVVEAFGLVTLWGIERIWAGLADRWRAGRLPGVGGPSGDPTRGGPRRAVEGSDGAGRGAADGSGPPVGSTVGDSPPRAVRPPRR